VEVNGPGGATTQPEETFTRRVCAVLLADVTGFSALMGQDDERTARAVRGLQTLVQEIAADNNGHAEGFAGDAIFASFDSVVAAVDAALKIQRRLTRETFEGLHLRIRIGVHYGDVLLREGAAFGDAINVAARLQTLAKPGTVCISEGVYRQVRNKFDERFVDLGRQRLKNISEPVHAYLIVPRELEGEQARRSRRALVTSILGGAVLATVIAMIAVIAVRYRKAPAQKPKLLRGVPSTGMTEPRAAAPAGEVAPASEEAGQLTLGVMLFKSLGGDGEQDWRREALRDGLNAQLSHLSHVKVYSKEFIDFLMTRKGLTDVEAASELGIKKMLSGSFVVVGGTLRVETHIVDVRTGVLDASYTTMGREQDFLDVQNKLALGVISHLNLPITDQEKRTLLARQSTDVEALKLLLEAEAGGSAPAEGKPPTPQRRSELHRWLARAAPFRAAHAANSNDKAEILAVIERYRRATEAREVQKLAAVYTDFSAEQEAAQQRYFENVRDLRVAIDNVDIAVVGDEAVASYTRTDDFVDARTGRAMHVAIRLTKTLRRVNGAWKLAAGK
jgi:adenylate cyclase